MTRRQSQVKVSQIKHQLSESSVDKGAAVSTLASSWKLLPPIQ